MNDDIRDIGTQDPDLKNSPIAWESDEDIDTLRQTIPVEPFCLFNGEVYSDGAIIKSGDTLLRCRQGLWVPAGSAHPNNP